MSEKEKVSSLITYLYETMNGELVLDYANLDSENIEILLDYIEKLENIIKEVRECIDNITLEKLDDFEKYKMIPLKDTWIGYSILEILDKENNNE